MHGMRRGVPGERCPADLRLIRETPRQPAERWRRRATRPDDHSRDSCLHLLRLNCGCEGYGPLANRLASQDLHGSRVSCKRCGTPWSMRRVEIRNLQTAQMCKLIGRNAFSSQDFSELFPPKLKFRPDRQDIPFVQYLNGPSENDRLLDLDVVGIELLETRGFREQSHRILCAQTAGLNPC